MRASVSGDLAGFVGEGFWSGTRQPMERATGLEPAAYTDEGFFDMERELLFGRAWVAVASVGEVAEPGRLLVRTVGGRSVLVTRGHDGALRGFVNSCRHRGTELASDDCTVAGTIRCPYHRWGYNLDGTLVATPRFSEVPRPGFDPAELALLPVRVEVWGLGTFVCLNPDTPPLRDWLGDLPERMAGYGFDRWRVHEKCSFDVAANWKLISENFQEYYHLPWVHPELAKVSRVRDHYRYQGPGMYCGQTTTPVSGDDRDDWLVLPPAVGLDESDSISGRFVAVFPNLLLAVLPNHAFVIRLEPLSAGVTREHCTFLLPPAADGDNGEIGRAGKVSKRQERGPAAQADDSDGKVTERQERGGAASAGTEIGRGNRDGKNLVDAFAATRRFWIEINSEDIDICERAQRGLTQGAAPPGPLSPRFEEPLHRFHNMVADCLTADCLAGLKVPAGDNPDDPQRYGCGPNPAPPAVEVAPPVEVTQRAGNV